MLFRGTFFELRLNALPPSRSCRTVEPRMERCRRGGRESVLRQGWMTTSASRFGRLSFRPLWSVGRSRCNTPSRTCLRVDDASPGPFVRIGTKYPAPLSREVLHLFRLGHVLVIAHPLSLLADRACLNPKTCLLMAFKPSFPGAGLPGIVGDKLAGRNTVIALLANTPATGATLIGHALPSSHSQPLWKQALP
jgi:hypothetical protein